MFLYLAGRENTSYERSDFAQTKLTNLLPQNVKNPE